MQRDGRRDARAGAGAADRDVIGVGARLGVVLDRADRPDRSWHQARAALRFTTAREPIVRYDELGALALLAEIPRDAARGNVEVAAIARLARNPDDLETLEVYCATGSLRRAAEILRLHDSSVSRRLNRSAASWASHSPNPPASPSPPGGCSKTSHDPTAPGTRHRAPGTGHRRTAGPHPRGRPVHPRRYR
ncbi:hypothetical protein ACIRL2_35965 [Embleya sp. NPDC127516]|uniref:hypothetical protein n=1 Tax=Embleya sp. NPDC127516 TaxID=3363990 RepID=UPI003830F420